MKFQKIEVSLICNFRIKALVRRTKLFFFPSKVGKKKAIVVFRGLELVTSIGLYISLASL